MDSWLTMLLSAFIGFGLLGAVLVYVERRLTSVSCPHCFKSIPKDTLKKRVPCPECEHPLQDLDVETKPTGECSLCQSQNPNATLWDGHSYCESCVGDVSPALLPLADNYMLSEELPYQIRVIGKRACWLYLRFVGGLPALILGFPMAITGGLKDGLFIGGFLLSIGVPVALVWSLASSFSLPLMKLKTMIWRGQLILRMGTHLYVMPLNDCSWYEGVMSDITIWQHGHLLRGPSLVIELPKSEFPEGNRLVVGCTSDSLEIWRAFLTIAKVPVGYKKTPRTWFSQVFRRSRKKREESRNP